MTMTCIEGAARGRWGEGMSGWLVIVAVRGASKGTIGGECACAVDCVWSGKEVIGCLEALSLGLKVLLLHRHGRRLNSKALVLSCGARSLDVQPVRQMLRPSE